MRPHIRRYSTAFLLTVLAFTAAAQEPDELSLEEALSMPLEELMTVSISIATGTPRSLAEAPAIATVITAADIRAMGATDLDQVLESVPGLHVSRTHLAYNPLYVMRGLHSDTSPYVLFLTNGVPMTQWLSGNIGEFWGGLPVAAISRVEVIRGPGSALFGADAVGGVINIVTKTAAEIGGVEAGVRGGSFDTAEGWLLYGGEHRGLDVALALQAWTTEGQRRLVETDTQTGFDRLFGTAASLAPGAVSTGGDGVEANLDLGRGDWRLRLGFQGRFDLGTGGGFNQALDRRGAVDRRRHTADLTWRRAELTPRWGLEVEASYLRDDGESDVYPAPPGATFNGFAVFPEGIHIAIGNTERHWRLGATATYRGPERHRLRLGAGTIDVDHAAIDSQRNDDTFGFPLPGGFQDVNANPALIFGTAQRRDIRFAFVQDEWKLARDWDLTVGVRWDRYSDFGDTVNPRLALVWKGSETLTAKLLYGRAFRPPSYREQYLISNPELLGNPALEPEVMNTVELGVSYRPGAHSRLGVNFFAYRLEDVILPFGPPPAVYRNVGERRGEGFEVEGEWTADAFELAGNYAYQESTDEATGQAGHAPGQQLYLRADWRFGRGFRLGAVLNAVADRERAFGDPRPPIDDFATVDLVLRREKLGRFDVGVVVRNLFDEDVREPSSFVPGFFTRFIENDLPLAGRAAFVELRFRR